MAPQVVRVGVVFAAIVAIFLVARSMAVPAGFGTNGFHRLEAPSLIAANPLVHAGRKACNECHPEKAEKSPHSLKGVGCESCHGPAEAHVKDFDQFKPKVPSTRSDCTRCHAAILARPAWFPTIDPRTHNPKEFCGDCHTIHPKE